MGEFLQCENSITFSKDDVVINGTSYKDKYPGYRFSSNSSNCNVLTEINGAREIIEVYGESYIEENENHGRFFRQNIVAVLKNEDAKLYRKLQWLNSMRWHCDVQLAQRVILFYLGIALLAVQFIVGLFVIETGAGPNGFLYTIGMSLVYSLLLVASEMILLTLGSRTVRIIYGFFSVLFHVLTGKEKIAYYKEIFERLSKANCTDKAKAARFMSKVLFFCYE